MWLEGEPGIGKSHLLADLVASAPALGVRVLTGAGDAVERSTPYHAWGDVLGQVGGGSAPPGPPSARPCSPGSARRWPRAHRC